MPRANKKSLALKSVNLRTTIAVLIKCDFEKRDGSAWDKSPEELSGYPVRKLTERDLNEIRKTDATKEKSPIWYDFLKGVRLMLDSRSDDPVAALKAYALIAPELVKIGFLRSTEPISPDMVKAGWLPSSLAIALEGIKLTFWNTKPERGGKPRPMPGLLCPDMKSAVAARWLLAPDRRVCPHCQTIFTTKRPKQTACSIQCREAHRSARWWAIKRLKEQAA